MDNNHTIRIVPLPTDFMNETMMKLYSKRVALDMIQNEMICTFKAPELAYHYTKKENVPSILKDGLKSGIDGGVFVSTDLKELTAYLKNNIIGATYKVSLRGHKTINTDRLEDYVILSFKPENSRNAKWYKQYVNKHIMFYHGDLQITDVKEIEV